MKVLKRAISQFRSTKTANIANYKIFQTLLGRYEELNLSTYEQHDPTRLIFGNPEYSRLTNQMDHMIDNLKNPFEELYHWCKGEIYDIQALQDSLAVVEAVDKKRKKYESKRNNA